MPIESFYSFFGFGVGEEGETTFLSTVQSALKLLIASLSLILEFQGCARTVYAVVRRRIEQTFVSLTNKRKGKEVV